MGETEVNEAEGEYPPVPKKWKFNVSSWTPTAEDLDTLLESVQEDERTRIRKFHFEADKKRALVGRLLLRWLVQQLHPDVENERIVFARSKTNKPVLLHPPKQPFSFNISHHGDWVVLVWHNENIVGLDAMEYSPPTGEDGNKGFFKTMRRSFHEDEWEAILSPKEDKMQLKEFYRFWTLKESYIKAIGQGLAFELSRMCFIYKDDDKKHAMVKIDGSLQGEWNFVVEELDEKHCVTVATWGEEIEEMWKTVEIKVGADGKSPKLDFLKEVV